MAKQGGGGGGGGAAGAGGEMMDLMKSMGLDASELEKMAADMDPNMLDELMRQMAEMSPEDLQKTMQDAMDLMAGDDMMGSLLQNRELILQQLEEAGIVDADELERYRKDPEYFEQKMKEGMAQMKDLFTKPEYLQAATETMKYTSEMYKNPEMAKELLGSMMGEISDEQIEEVRQVWLKDPSSSDLLKQMMLADADDKEVQAILNDPVKWRESVKKGLGMLTKPGAGVGAGAGVGEL
jgi:hypothetical protein